MVSEHPLVYIIRGLPQPFDQGVARELADYLEARQKTGSATMVGALQLMEQLAAASKLMIPRTEYDIEDFNSLEIREALDLLDAGDLALWGQLLDAVNTSVAAATNSGELLHEYKRLKGLSPFADEFLLFFDVDGGLHLRTELDPDLAEAFRRLIEVPQFPGNTCMAVVPKDAIRSLRFVDTIDAPPATV